MAHTAILTSPTGTGDLYLSDYFAGEHGDQFQQDLALVIFERATRKGYDFRLGCDMAIADKFVDVALFNKSKYEWTLLTPKHADTWKGKTQPLKFDMLFPKDEATRDRGDFSLFKYLKSYMTVQANIKERKNIVIFTNKDFLTNSLEPSVEIEPRLVDEILLFENAANIGLKVADRLINEMVNYVNRDFNSLRNSIAKLFTEGIMDPVIKNFKTPVASMLIRTSNSVKFSKLRSLEANELFSSLSEFIDIHTAELPLDKCKDIFAGKSRIKTFPLCANVDTVHQFFRDLILSVRQPDDLRDIIDRDMRSWMRTWIRPDYLQCLEERQLEIVTDKLVKILANQHVEHSAYCTYKRFLQLNDGFKFFETAKQKLQKHIQSLPIYNVNDVSEYYISRQIDCTERSDGIKDEPARIRISDDQFVNELSGKFKNRRFFLIAAEAGMGKSTLLEYIALAAQQEGNNNVYLFYLNRFNQALSQVKETDDRDELLLVFRPMLSESNFNGLQETISRSRDKKTTHWMIFDGFEDILPHQRKKILLLFKCLLNIPNVKIILSALTHLAYLVKNDFNVEVMSLVAFDDRDQTNFLRKFWKVLEKNENRFLEYVEHLFRCLQSALFEMTVIPFMLKMLAEVFTDHFHGFIYSEQNDLEMITPQHISTVNLYEGFSKKCFCHKFTKMICEVNDMDEGYELLFEKFILEHQLLALKQLQMTVLKNILREEEYARTLNDFEKRIINGTERSPLVQVFDNCINFIHSSYAEFFVAKFLFQHIKIYESKIFGAKSVVNFFDEFPVIRTFFFTMIEERFASEHLKILEKHYKKNSRIIIWACEVHGQRTVNDLLHTTTDPTITNELLCVASKYNCYNICSNLIRNYQAEVNTKNNESLTPLHFAAKYGKLEVVKILLDHGADVNARNNEKSTPLHFTSKYGHSEVVKILIDHDADVNAKNYESSTPLHFATKYGHTDVVKILIDHGADVNAKNYESSTPLHFAAKNNHSKIVEILIDFFANIEAKNNTSLTPLHLAAENGHSVVVKILINHCANVNTKNNKSSTPLHFAAEKGHLEVVKILLHFSENIDEKNSKGLTPLDLAVENGHTDIIEILSDHTKNVNGKKSEDLLPFDQVAQKGNLEVEEILLQHSPDFNIKKYQDWTPLHYAAQRGRYDDVKMLIEQSANVNVKTKESSTPLHLAAEYGHTEVVQILLEYSEHVNEQNKQGFTPLHWAARNGFLEIVKILLQRSAIANTKDSETSTPLHFAAENGHSDVVQILTSQLENIDKKNSEGSTPLHQAAKNGHPDVVKMLIEKLASINTKDINGWTPLHCAANYGHTNAILILIAKSIDVNAKEEYVKGEDFNGFTSLHLAAQNGHSDVVQTLIDYSDNINVKNIEGSTPLHLAALNGHWKVVQLLVDHSGDISAKNSSGSTPLHLAALHGHSEVAKILIEHSWKISAETK